MATIKSYTDLPQSKKLAEILLIESADMHYIIMGDDEDPQSMVGLGEYIGMLPTIPCWSLAALLNVLPSSTLDSSDNHRYRFRCMERYTEWYDNAIDACVEMILKLHKRKML